MTLSFHGRSTHRRRRALPAAIVTALVLLAALVAVVVVRSTGPSRPEVSTGMVPVGAGGLVSGLSFSDDGTTRLVNTDTFGGYRWNGRQWSLNTTPSSLPRQAVRVGQGGVLATVAAPGDHDRAYMAFEDSIFGSRDGGRSWTLQRKDVQTSFDQFKTWGPRMAVDPDDADVAYYGTQLDGLLRTTDGGRSWSNVGSDALPAPLEVDVGDDATRGALSEVTNQGDPGPQIATAGVSAIAVDPSSPTVDGAHRTVYAAVYGRGIYRSDDAGSTWRTFSPPQIKAVRTLRVRPDGGLLVTAYADPTFADRKSQVWRSDDQGSWQQVTPALSADWQALAVDPHQPDLVAMVAQGGQVALSGDGGDTWATPPRREDSTGDVGWLSWSITYGTDFMSPGQIAFDPARRGRLWFAEGTGVWYADVSTSTSRVLWHSQARGIEELAATDVVAPPGGEPVLGALDRPLFRADSLRSYPRTYGPRNKFSSAWSVDWSVSDPDYLVASVASYTPPASDPRESSYSTDGGRSWRALPGVPLGSTNALSVFGFGSIAVGAPGHLVWAPAFGKRPYVTADNGRSWTPVVLPGVSDYSKVNPQPWYINRRELAADKTDADTFYMYVLETGFFRSTDSGRSWSQVSDNAPFKSSNMAYDVTLKAEPGREGSLLMTPGDQTKDTEAPLFRSTDGGGTWDRVPGLTGVSAFGFGKPLSGSSRATVYAAGHHDGDYGIWYSGGGTSGWRKAATFPAGRTAAVTSLDGDKDVAGLAYLGLAGAGWSYVKVSGLD